MPGISDKAVRHVLLIEDNPDDAFLMRNILDREQFQVRLITDGMEALHVLVDDAGTYDAILLDCNLPHISGLSILAELGDRAHLHPIIMITADSSIETAVEAMRRGAYDFHPKILGFDDIPEKIRRVAASCNMRRRTIELQEELRRSERRYRTIFENTQDVYFEEGFSGRIIEISPAVESILKYSREELVGSNIQYFYYNKNDYENFLHRISAEKQVNQYELYLRDKSGQIVVCSITAKLLEDTEEGEPLIVGTIRDISEYRRLENLFRQSQKMDAIGRVSGGIAHDFNNLLTVIVTSTELARMKISEPEYVDQKLHVVLKTADSAASLARKLLAFGKRNVIEGMICDLNELLKASESIIRRMIGEDVRISVRFCSTPATVKVDSTHLEQIIMNLVSNARDAMPDGGQLDISVSHTEFVERDNYMLLTPGEYIVLTVKDSGCGISDEVREMMFEPFFTTKGEKGTGLGLATVYGIVKQAGGDIEVLSEFGRGAEFRIYMPHQIPQQIKRLEEPEKKRGQSGCERVLLVEDEQLVRKVISQMLSALGYEVFEAVGPYAAIDVITKNEQHIDLILTDIVMPDMNGVEMARRILSLSPNMPFLFMSAYANRKVLEDPVIDIGHNFISKPFKRDFFAKKIREVLDNSSVAAVAETEYKE